MDMSDGLLSGQLHWSPESAVEMVSCAIIDYVPGDSNLVTKFNESTWRKLALITTSTLWKTTHWKLIFE